MSQSTVNAGCLIKIRNVIIRVSWVLFVSIISNSDMINSRDKHQGPQNEQWPSAVVVLEENTRKH